MRIGNETVGPAGGSLLGLAAAIALGLGAAGISNHVAIPAAPATAPAASGHTPARGAAGPAPFVPSHVGPTLQASPYAEFAQRLYPGTPNSTAQTMLSGLQFSVQHQGGFLVVMLRQASTSKPLLYRSYPSGYSFYIADPNASDDMPPLGEYDPADDVFLAVNPQGHVVT